MIIKPNKCTIKYLDSRIKGYVDKSIGIEKFQNEIKEKYKLDRIIRFDLGENSDGHSIKVSEELEYIKKNPELISDYPDSNYLKLKNELATFYGVDIANITIGAGSSEIIKNISRCWLDNGDCAVLPIPSFYLIENTILEVGGIPIHVQLMKEKNFQWTDDTQKELLIVSSNVQPKLIWIVTPNNPTGGITPIEDIIKIIENNQNSIIIVDEAYGEYVNEKSAIDFVNKYENILVLRTFSKAYGMAGLRLGYCIGSKELIKILEQIRLEFPITSITERIGIIALRDQDHLDNTRKRLFERKKLLFDKLEKIKNIEHVRSETNVMLIKLRNSKNLYKELLKKGILTAKMNDLKGYVRITIKNEEENELLIKNLEKIQFIDSGV
jgi:histidinol-phosphate aminotransferase